MIASFCIYLHGKVGFREQACFGKDLRVKDCVVVCQPSLCVITKQLIASE